MYFLFLPVFSKYKKMRSLKQSLNFTLASISFYVPKGNLSNGVCLVEQPNLLLHVTELYSLCIFYFIPGKLEIA